MKNPETDFPFAEHVPDLGGLWLSVPDVQESLQSRPTHHDWQRAKSSFSFIY